MAQRIGYLIDSFVGPWAGTERQLWHLLEGLDRERFEPHLFLLRDCDYSVQAQDWPCPVDVLGLEKIASPGGVAGVLRLARLFRQKQISLAQGFFLDASLVGPVAARLAGARFIAGRRDMGIWYTRNNLKLLRLVGRLVDRVIANSRAVGDHVVREEGIPADRLSIIFNGLEPTQPGEGAGAPVPGVPEGVPVVGIVANLRQVKRHEDLIRAIALVRETVPDVQLVIVGEGELEQALRALADSCGVAAATHFLGRVTAPRSVVRRFTVAALCSESEGLSNALMEYLSEGKPSVCTDAGGNPELVTDGYNGFLYPVGDVSGLADRLVRLLTDAALVGSMGMNASRSVARLGIPEMLAQHMAVYDSILQD